MRNRFPGMCYRCGDYVPNNGALPIVTEHPCAPAPTTLGTHGTEDMENTRLQFPDARAARLRELDAEVARTAEEAADCTHDHETAVAFRAIAAAARARAEG